MARLSHPNVLPIFDVGVVELGKTPEDAPQSRSTLLGAPTPPVTPPPDTSAASGVHRVVFLVMTALVSGLDRAIARRPTPVTD